MKFQYAGGLGKGGTATLFVDEKQVTQGRIPQTVVVRFSLDETFGVGEDTGTPVVEDYVDKMPYAFTGTLQKLLVILEPEKLAMEDRERLRQEAARAYLAVQ